MTAENECSEDTGNLLHRLRSVAQDCIVKHSYISAQFFADKAASLSSFAPKDTFLLARTYFLTGQYARAAFLLSSHGLVDRFPSCRCLATQCHVAVKAWDQAMTVVGDGNESSSGETSAQAADDAPGGPDSGYTNVAAMLALLRGKIHEALDNRSEAVRWYKSALALDGTCVEALQRLAAHGVGGGGGAIAALLPATPPDHALAPLYAATLPRPPATVPSDGPAVLPATLQDNAEVQASVATQHYNDGNLRACYSITAKILDADPFHHACLPTHLACQVGLRDTNGLFYLAHKLVDSHPDNPIAWYAVACYYHLVGQHDGARKYFGRASQLDIHCGPAWLGLGHSFAAQGEHDQALAAYCTAARLMSGCHVPLLHLGMEYAAASNARMAQQHLTRAHALCPHDPAVIHETGVIAYKTGRFKDAAKFFRKALRLSKDKMADYDTVGTTLCNLARAQLKLGQYDDAIACYHKALALDPRVAAVHTGLAYAHHCMGQLQAAIASYHKALGLRADDTFSAQMLALALSELAAAPAVDPADNVSIFGPGDLEISVDAAAGE
eukprot:m.399553 g.399553  ORF g.399553 m.399553 type:complete len:556 (-) comp21150_c0_seq1:543-2210(-)